MCRGIYRVSVKPSIRPSVHPSSIYYWKGNWQHKEQILSPRKGIKWTKFLDVEQIYIINQQVFIEEKSLTWGKNSVPVVF